MLLSPITVDDYSRRITETKARMAKEGSDLLLVFADPWRSGNCRYLCGIRPSRAMMIISLEDDLTLWVTDFEVEWVKRQLAAQTVEEEPWINVSVEP